MIFWLDGPTVKVKIRKTKVFFFHGAILQGTFFLLFLNLNILTIAGFFFLRHWQIRFLDQKKTSIVFLIFQKFECCFLFTVSHIPVQSVLKIPTILKLANLKQLSKLVQVQSIKQNKNGQKIAQQFVPKITPKNLKKKRPKNCPKKQPQTSPKHCANNHTNCFPKGQLISEWLFDVLNFPKKQRKKNYEFLPRNWLNWKNKGPFIH